MAKRSVDPEPLSAPLALLADSDPDTRAMYAEYLRYLHFQIDEAEDGRIALAKALARRPSVVVTDTRLPGIGGLELCRLLKRDPETSAVPIVVVTGEALPSDVKLAEAAGVDAVLVKPCLPERLAFEIRRVMTQAGELGGGADSTAIERPVRALRRLALSRTHKRHDTLDPPDSPPALRCACCDLPLDYLSSHVGGVSERHTEQWDNFECPRCRKAFEYRHRTRKVRPCPARRTI